MNKSIQIANELIARSASQGEPITNLSLQKLIFFAHGWYLALTGEPLVDEEFEAWRYGPVLSSLYHKFKGFSSNPIPENHPFSKSADPLEAASSPSRVLDKILDVYGKYPGYKLVSLSHDPNGPWAAVYNNSDSGIHIPNEKIKEYFQLLASKNK